MDFYKLRIDTDDTESVIALLDRYSYSYLVGFENQEGSNPHIHAYLETNTKGPTLRASIRKYFGGGNGSYSLKTTEEDPLEYIAYIIKDGRYEEENIDPELLTRALEYDRKIKAEIKEKKANRRTTLQKIEDRYFSDIVGDGPYILSKLDQHVTPSYIAESVVSYYKEEGILIRKFMLVSLVQTLCLKYTQTYANTLKNELLEALKPSIW